MEIPPDATHESEIYMGSPSITEQGLRVRVWNGKLSELHGPYPFSSSSSFFYLFGYSIAFQNENNHVYFLVDFLFSSLLSVNHFLWLFAGLWILLWWEEGPSLQVKQRCPVGTLFRVLQSIKVSLKTFLLENDYTFYCILHFFIWVNFLLQFLRCWNRSWWPTSLCAPGLLWGRGIRGGPRWPQLLRPVPRLKKTWDDIQTAKDGYTQ